MSLPKHNPIDIEWFVRGTPVDHIGTQSRNCPACGKQTVHECFHVVYGSPIGFGAPVFVKPFLKKSSTKGKIGGTRGELSQCTVCDSLWPMNLDGSSVLMKMGLNHEGAVNPLIAYQAKNDAARAAEDEGSTSTDGTPQSKVRKSRE
jgi:hypothetical protein